MNQNIIVTESSVNLRALGRNALTGKWGMGVLGTLIFFALTTVPAIILDEIFGGGLAEPSPISSIYSFLIAGPMMLGYAMFAISIFRKRETSPAEVFYGFERFGKAFGLYIVTSIFIALWTVLLIVPGIIAAIRYSMSFYILADNPNIGIMDAINESKRLMNGNKWKFFCLNLSFIGWAILCLFTMGIGFLWLAPYFEVTMIAFYDIANGSLRSVRTINGAESAEEKETEDPITVYKEAPELKEPESEMPELKEPESEVPEFKEPEDGFEPDNNEKI